MHTCHLIPVPSFSMLRGQRGCYESCSVYKYLQCIYVIINFHCITEPIVVQPPTSKTDTVPTVESTTQSSSSTTVGTVTMSDSNSTKSTNHGNSSALVSTSISSTSTISPALVSTHSSAVHTRSTPAPKQSSETNHSGI